MTYFVHFLYCLSSLSYFLCQSLAHTPAKGKFPYCPVEFQAVNDQCFRLVGTGNIKTARKACAGIGASVPEIFTWEQQDNLEAFLKGKNVEKQAWLNGELLHTKHREGAVKLHWSNQFFPKLHNFKDFPLEVMDNPKDCVYISHEEPFYWGQVSCHRLLNIICVTRLRHIWKVTKPKSG